MNKTYYISGPMTGIENYNYPLFNKVAAELRAQGRTVVNPSEVNMDITKPWHEFMLAAIISMVDIGHNNGVLYLLPGWETSKGAYIESMIALDMQWKVENYNG